MKKQKLKSKKGETQNYYFYEKLCFYQKRKKGGGGGVRLRGHAR